MIRIVIAALTALFLACSPILPIGFGFPAAVTESPVSGCPEYCSLSEDSKVLTIRLDANSSTGYEWICMLENAELLEPVWEGYVPDQTDELIDGAGGTYYAEFRAADRSDSGLTVIRLRYARGMEEVIDSRSVIVLMEEDGTLAVLGELTYNE